MCGIGGWINWDINLSTQNRVLTEMSKTLVHRGPDGQAVWIDNSVAFVHRRLEIIDPIGGKQPMIIQKAGNKYVITFNGEIYNYKELHNELVLKGHNFKTESDTEVLLLSYLEWGVDCLNHINGIFAFAIWDERQNRVFLARDPLGVKPLYYSVKENELVFGSELKTLLAHPKINPIINEDGLSEVLTMSPMRTPGHGIFKDIDELRAGHFILFTPSHFKKVQYWKLISKQHNDSEKETAAKINNLMDNIVQKQLRSDAPIGTLLSGGLDSSGISAIAKRHINNNELKTFSIEFLNNKQHFHQDLLHRSLDSPWVEKMASYLNTQHRNIQFDSKDLMEHIYIPLKAKDFPSVGEMESSLYLFFKDIKKSGTTVVLSGEGADEIFGGYPWFYKNDNLPQDTFPWAHVQRFKWLSPKLVKKMDLYDYMRDKYNEALGEVPIIDGESENESKKREMLYLNITRFLPFLLERKDRMSMANGLEVRVPFCDADLVQYVWNIPWEMKNFGGMEKGILRSSFENWLPDDVIYRKKSAYPFIQDPEYLDTIRREVSEIISNNNSPVSGFINQKEVIAYMERYQTADSHPLGITGIIRTLDSIVQLNKWFEGVKLDTKTL